MFDRTIAEKHLWILRCKNLKVPELEAMVGGLSKPSKMPWYSYSIPAEHCKVGSKLRKAPGSVCSKCYAMKGRYKYSSVANAMQRRYDIIQKDVNLWAAAFVILLERKAKDSIQFFRWHDSGDLIDKEHLRAILFIANKLPYIKFWLPTKEYKLVTEHHDVIKEVGNLAVRVSAPMVGEQITFDNVPGLVYSSVGANKGMLCGAQSNKGKCGACRACWNKNVTNVDYPLH